MASAKRPRREREPVKRVRLDGSEATDGETMDARLLRKNTCKGRKNLRRAVFVEGQSAVGKTYLTDRLAAAPDRFKTFKFDYQHVRNVAAESGSDADALVQLPVELLEASRTEDPRECCPKVASVIERCLNTVDDPDVLIVCDRSPWAWSVYRCLFAVPEEERATAPRWFGEFCRLWFVGPYYEAWKPYRPWLERTVVVLCRDYERLLRVSRRRDYDVDRALSVVYHRTQYLVWKWLAEIHEVETLDVSEAGDLHTALCALPDSPRCHAAQIKTLMQ